MVASARLDFDMRISLPVARTYANAVHTRIGRLRWPTVIGLSAQDQCLAVAGQNPRLDAMKWNVCPSWELLE